jgi:hypothetical protein
MLPLTSPPLIVVKAVTLPNWSPCIKFRVDVPLPTTPLRMAMAMLPIK